jgi:Fic family protein
MYIEKRKEKEGIKYFLAHSYREGKIIQKIRKYLGKNLSKELIEDRRKKAEQLILEEINQYRIIKDPLKVQLSNEEINLVKNLEKSQKLRVCHLSEYQWKAFSETFAYNTNAIEGSELTNKDVKNIIGKNEWPKKSKGDIAEAYGVNNSITFVRYTREHISIKLIKILHEIVFKNSKEFAGHFRKPREEVVIKNGSGEIIHYGAPQSRIIPLLQELIDWYHKHKNEYPALILASVVHNQFENIHPFKDGNGRVGRLLLNNILIKNGLPPVNIDFRNRMQYYRSLQEYQKRANLRPTIDLLIKEYKALKRFAKC